MLIGINDCLDGVVIVAARATVCRKIVRRTPASTRGAADTEPTCDAGIIEQRERSALCCPIDYSSTGRRRFADIERIRSCGHCAGASAGGHRNVLSHDIARGAIERGLEPIVLATHSVDGKGSVVRNGSKCRGTRAARGAQIQATIDNFTSERCHNKISFLVNNSHPVLVATLTFCTYSVTQVNVSGK